MRFTCSDGDVKDEIVCSVGWACLLGINLYKTEQNTAGANASVECQVK